MLPGNAHALGTCSQERNKIKNAVYLRVNILLKKTKC
jgi:hypothetical protein